MINAETKLLNALKVDATLHYITLGEHTIRFLVAGKGPPLILLHGLNMGWGQWYPNIPFLSQHFTVYAIDLPGSGGSSILNYHHADLSKDFLDVVVQFIVQKKLGKVYLIGHSFSAWICIQIARLHPEIVRKILLLAPLGFSSYMPLAFRPITLAPINKILTRMITPEKKNIPKIIGMLMDQSMLAAHFIDYYSQSLLSKPNFSHPFAFIQRLSSPLSFKKEILLVDCLGEVTCETMVILGKNDPLIVHQKNLPAVQKLPRGSYKIFENVRHVPAIEAPDRFHATVSHFFQ